VTLPAAVLRRRAAELGLRPTKRWGQNFVVDPNTVRRIARLAGVGPGEDVLEVGPGLGSLTLALLETGAAVTAVEIDPVLAAALPTTVAEAAPDALPRLRVLTADALAVMAGEDVAASTPWHLVANLPYNVAVPVVLHLLAELPDLVDGLVMVQAEVAERLAAPPGSRRYGVPSVKAAWDAEVQWAGAVPRTVFWPVPNVDSGLVSLVRRPPPPGASRAATFAVVDAAFAQRRKMLRSALAPLAGSPAAAEAALVAAGIDPTLRAEQLDVAAFARLGAALDVPAR
jgi:16S rRNA (adenine1518-N6/adenine1519-N6)-dimethyltransferase